MRNRPARWPVLLVAACLAVAGCGGDDEENEQQSSSAAGPASRAAPEAPEPKQDIEEFAQLLQKALTSPDCEGLKTKVNKPEEGGIQVACPARHPQVARALAGYETTGAGAYGSGGLIDYTAAEAPKGGTWELSLGGDGTWVIDAGSVTGGKTVGTKLENRGGFEKALEGFLEAVHEEDCDLFFRYTVTASRDRPTACKQELPVYDSLATVLKADPESQPFFMGGNERYAFYGLETSKPEPAYRTATVVKSADGASQPYLVARTKLGPEP